MLHLTLEQGASVTTMLAVGVALLLSAAFYRRAMRGLRGRRSLVLLVLRWVAIVLVVLLLFRPVVSYRKKSSTKPVVAVLVDRSASMGTADGPGGRNRFDQAREAAERWWPELRRNFEPHLFTFAEDTQTHPAPDALDATQPRGQATSIAAALREVGRATRDGRLEVVLLLSDGIQNAAGDPAAVAEQLGATVHTVGVGTLRQQAAGLGGGDVRLIGLDAPGTGGADRMLRGNLARITASVEAEGLAGRVVTVVLKQNDAAIDRRQVTLDAIEGGQQVVFEVRPDEPGRQRFTAEVEPLVDERIRRNNRRSVVAMVVEPGIRVLYLEGKLRAEYGALVDRFLARDPDVQFAAFVQTRPGVFLYRSNMNVRPEDSRDVERHRTSPDVELPAEFGRFDVFIIGDLDSDLLGDRRQQAIRERVEAGAGLVMLGGYHSLGPGGYRGTPLGDILPVRLGGRDVGQITTPLLPVLTAEGERHPIFANIAQFFPADRRTGQNSPLPPLAGCTRVLGPSPTATVLAVLPSASVGLPGSAEGPHPGPLPEGEGTRSAGSLPEGEGTTEPMPVLAVQPIELGRTAVFCGDTTRAWQQGPRVRDERSPFLQFWGQMVRWLAGRSDRVSAGASVTARVEGANYRPGQQIEIVATVRDRRGEATDAARATATVNTPEGQAQQVELSPDVGTPGRYTGRFKPRHVGNHTIDVQAKLQAIAQPKQTPRSSTPTRSTSTSAARAANSMN